MAAESKRLIYYLPDVAKLELELPVAESRARCARAWTQLSNLDGIDISIEGQSLEKRTQMSGGIEWLRCFPLVLVLGQGLVRGW